ncbi:MAG TPA: hypothetical protein VFU59_04690 [Candidatus Eisenbacteria bacterium]|nr:hypothetical protein [Candidatus Eisenbacteria bacterium]
MSAAGASRDVRRRLGRVAATAFALGAVLALAAPTGDARELMAGSDGSRLELRTSLKAAGLFSLFPAGLAAATSQDASEGFWRARFELEARPGGRVTAVAAYEHRWRAASAIAGGNVAAGILPGSAVAPFRIRPLDWSLAEPPGVTWRHEIDRAFLALHGARTELTIGRQAIGWGRGVLFGAVDLFAPFHPLEADREWRRGVDAVRGDLRLGERSSVEAVAAFGEEIPSSAFGARLRGYAGEIDGELLAGRRGEDWFAGATASAAVGGAEAHGEAAAFRLPESIPGEGRSVWKLVAGASYQFRVGHGLPLFAEYHYSGFGAPSADEVPVRFGSARLVARYLRGDTQILSRHAAALWTTYEFDPEWSVGGTILAAPSDGSGLIEPSVTFSAGNRFSFRASLYLPFGAGLREGDPGSFYGATPRSLWVQIAFVD